MPSTLVDLVKIYAASQGTGPIVLGTTVPGFRGLEALVDGATYSYTVQQGANFEVGRDVFDGINSTLNRGVIYSSRGNAPIPLTPNAVVTFTALADDLAGESFGRALTIADVAGLAPALEERPTGTALAAGTGAAEIGTATGATVEARLVAETNARTTADGLRPTSTTLAAIGGAALIGSNDGASGAKWSTVAGFFSYLATAAGSTVVGFVQTGTGAVVRTILDKLTDTVNAKDFGATGDGSTNDGPALQLAFNTGKNVRINPGNFRVLDKITVTTPGQQIKGSGRTRTRIQVDGSFNLSATAVMETACGPVTGAELSDFGFYFAQPDTTVRANLIAYPPALLSYSQPRTRLWRMRFQNAMTAIDWRGNTGGAFMHDIDMAMFNYGVRLDGSLDTVRISNMQVVPFFMTPNQETIFYDANNVAIDSGRCDGLEVIASTFLNGGKSTNFYAGFGGSYTFGSMIGCNFDSHANAFIYAGNISFTGCTVGVTNVQDRGIYLNGGANCTARITGCQFLVAANTTGAIVEINGTGGAPSLVMTGNKFYVYSDAICVYAQASAGAAALICTDNEFWLPVGTTQAQPVIAAVAGSRATITGNRATDKGANAGTFIRVDQDNFHVIADNVFTGWGLTLPSSYSTLRAVGNLGVASGDLLNGYVVGNEYTRVFKGTADGSGVVRFAHGITSGPSKINNVQGYSKGGAGEMVNLSLAFVDAGFVQMTGAGASAAYRVSVRWVEGVAAW